MKKMSILAMCAMFFVSCTTGNGGGNDTPTVDSSNSTPKHEEQEKVKPLEKAKNYNKFAYGNEGYQFHEGKPVVLKVIAVDSVSEPEFGKPNSYAEEGHYKNFFVVFKARANKDTFEYGVDICMVDKPIFDTTPHKKSENYKMCLKKYIKYDQGKFGRLYNHLKAAQKNRGIAVSLKLIPVLGYAAIDKNYDHALIFYGSLRGISIDIDYTDSNVEHHEHENYNEFNNTNDLEYYFH